jgi:hypothetical protein
MILAPPAMLAHLHAQHAAIHTQHHHRRSVLGGYVFTPAVGMVLAHRFAMAGGRLAQPLHGLPQAHGADFDPQQLPC